LDRVDQQVEKRPHKVVNRSLSVVERREEVVHLE